MRNVDVFWGEFNRCAHMVQLYEDVDILMDSLDGFIGGGLEAGDAAVVIATPIHLMLLERRLEARGIDLESARDSDRYIALDAEQTLQQFMVGNWPDAERFDETVRGIIVRARGDSRKVRAFGEMVALLWAAGHRDAVVRLEQLWHSFCQRTEDMALFCAYPKADIMADTSSALVDIFRAHSAVVGGVASTQTH